MSYWICYERVLQVAQWRCKKFLKYTWATLEQIQHPKPLHWWWLSAFIFTPISASQFKQILPYKSSNALGKFSRFIYKKAEKLNLSPFCRALLFFHFNLTLYRTLFILCGVKEPSLCAFFLQVKFCYFTLGMKETIQVLHWKIYSVEMQEK